MAQVNEDGDIIKVTPKKRKYLDTASKSMAPIELIATRKKQFVTGYVFLASVIPNAWLLYDNWEPLLINYCWPFGFATIATMYLVWKSDMR